MQNYESWGTELPYSIMAKSVCLGCTEARPLDNRACVSYYLTDDGYIVASRNNYGAYWLSPQLGGSKVIDGRIINRKGNDVTDSVINDIMSNYSVAPSLMYALNIACPVEVN